MTDITQTAAEATTEQVETVAEQVTESNVVEIPEKYKGKSLEDVIKMHQEAEKFIGKKVEEMPEEVVNKFLKVPDAPEKYLINEELDKNISEVLKEVGLKNKISQDQMKGLTDKLIEMNRANKLKAEEDVKTSINAEQIKLKQKFGNALEDRVNGIKALLNQYGSDDISDKIKASGLLHNFSFVEFLDNITQDVLKHTAVGSDFTKRTLTPSEAKAEIANKRADKEFMEQYLKRGIGHEQAVQKMEELYKIAFQS